MATSVGYSEERADSGAVVNPSWLFTTTCTVPPVRYPVSWESSSVSATTPWPAKAASPWTRTDKTSKRWSALSVSCLARTMPSTTGSTASRCDGFDAKVTDSSDPDRATNLPVAPLWYLTSPEPWTESGSRSPSNSRKISP